jgi:hypothetical protein
VDFFFILLFSSSFRAFFLIFKFARFTFGESLLDYFRLLEWHFRFGFINLFSSLFGVFVRFSLARILVVALDFQLLHRSRFFGYFSKEFVG